VVGTAVGIIVGATVGIRVNSCTATVPSHAVFPAHP
jgi:hypothetical protein